MNYKKPEQAGISSASIKKYIDILEANHLSTHDVIIARGNDILFEKYWEPFHPDFLHRMYSVSKSIVSLAVGFAEQDGLLSLDDAISKYFREEMAEQKDKNMQNQTIRHMLMMSTAKPFVSWFRSGTKDRVKFYFENDSTQSRPSGTIYEYDSTGSFVLGALVERLTGMPFMDYLRIKLFDKIGVSKEAFCLKCPGGHSWGDSGVLCTPRDLLLIARFVMNKGMWNGEQILNERYVTAAVSKQIDNNGLNADRYNTMGYGYLFWRTRDNSFFFNGMGCQFAVCVPDRDIILIYNGDNQGDADAKSIIINNFFECIVLPAADAALPENKAAEEALDKDLKLMCAAGDYTSEFQEKIDGAEYIVKENPMGITKFSLKFAEDCCFFHYTNAQGDKTLRFAMKKNVIDIFPQEGYSDQVGGVSTKNFYYRCAASAAWIEPQKLFIKVQIIDQYFGRLNIILGFSSENSVGIYMNKTAENFLNEYVGFAEGFRVK